MSLGANADADQKCPMCHGRGVGRHFHARSAVATLLFGGCLVFAQIFPPGGPEGRKWAYHLVLWPLVGLVAIFARTIYRKDDCPTCADEPATPGALPVPAQCPRCGYDLTGNESCTCPECGERI